MRYYHVTKQCNLAGIAASGLDPARGGSNTGMSAARGTQQFLDNSIGKIHITSSWETVKRYIEHSFTLLERDGISNPSQCPAVLALWLPNIDQGSLTDDPDDPNSGSYFMTVPISVQCIKVAMADPEDDDAYQNGRDVRWLELTTLQNNRHLIPTYPDNSPVG